MNTYDYVKLYFAAAGTFMLLSAFGTGMYARFFYTGKNEDPKAYLLSSIVASLFWLPVITIMIPVGVFIISAGMKNLNQKENHDLTLTEDHFSNEFRLRYPDCSGKIAFTISNDVGINGYISELGIFDTASDISSLKCILAKRIEKYVLGYEHNQGMDNNAAIQKKLKEWLGKRNPNR